ncbi:DnaB-like helicase C-terminal domain-containing protein [Bacteroidota bacterium]
MIFDFDGADLNEVKEEVVRFCNYLESKYDIDYNEMSIFFSGSKGFHVELPIELFEKEITPRMDYHKIYKETALKIINGFEYADSSIYDFRRLLRLPNTINSISGLYKIPLTFSELVSNEIEDIKHLADSPREFEFIERDELEVKPLLNELYLSRVKATDSLRKDQVSNFEEALGHFVNVPEGKRNSKAIQLVGYLIDKGHEHKEIVQIMSMWNKGNDPPLPEDELTDLIRNAYKRYGNEDSPEDDRWKDILSIGEAYDKMVQDILEDGEGIGIGYSKLDKHIKGLKKGETMCIIGKTGVGKSFLLQNIGRNFVQLHDKPVLFFSMEMPASTIIERGIQMETNMKLEEIYEEVKNDKTKTDSVKEVLTHSLSNFHVIDKSGLSLEDIENYIRHAEEHIYRQKTGLVLIDYLGLIRAKGKDLYERTSIVARGLKDSAKNLDVPIIFLSQTTKQFSVTDELTIGSARDSGSIDEASDYVLGLWSLDHGYVGEGQDSSLGLGIIKNRKGATAKTKITMSAKSLLMEQS